jgi:hypothetical protein
MFSLLEMEKQESASAEQKGVLAERPRISNRRLRLLRVSFLFNAVLNCAHLQVLAIVNIVSLVSVLLTTWRNWTNWILCQPREIWFALLEWVTDQWQTLSRDSSILRHLFLFDVRGAEDMFKETLTDNIQKNIARHVMVFSVFCLWLAACGFLAIGTNQIVRVLRRRL